VPPPETEDTGELLTPTGAAVLTAVAAGYGPLPAMTVRQVGYGCGGREGKTRPNVLRVLIGEAAEETGAGGDTLWLIEANLDDVTGEQAAFAIARLLAVGARDAWAAPVTMKKGRPGIVLSALADEQHAAAAEEVFFAETTTFGVRRSRVTRSILERESVSVDTAYGPIRVKLGRRGGRLLQAAAEFEDCRAAAEAAGVPLRRVAEAAMAAWRAEAGDMGRGQRKKA
jgi:uncharacterized protein (DUF111 family)